MAYHAALPLVLTPELLNYLRSKFLMHKVPWTAEADLLLSDLCEQVGYGLYSMDLPVRNYLLQEMRKEVGVARMSEVARLLIGYLHHLAQADPTAQAQELQSQRWAAMAYIDDARAQVVDEVVQALNHCILRDPQNAESVRGVNWNELARLLRLIDELAPQLSSYPELMEYAKLASTIMSDVSGDETLMLLETNILSAQFKVGDRALPKLEVLVGKSKYHKISAAAIVHHDSWKGIVDAFDNRTPVTGTVISAVRGGLRVDVGGIVAFLPASEIDIYFVANLELFQGQEIEAFVIEASREKSSLVLSRKALIEEKETANVEEAFANLDLGIIVEGEIQEVTDFGAFVSLGKTEGLIHVREMSWGFTEHPRDLFTVGQKVIAKIIGIDRKNAEIDLSYRELLPNPWLGLDQRYRVGMRLIAKVRAVGMQWIHLEVEPQIVGRLSLKEARRSQEQFDALLKIGQEVNVLIIAIDVAKTLLRFSLKESLEDVQSDDLEASSAWDDLEKASLEGTTVKGKVIERIKGGLLVDIDGITAFLPGSLADVRLVRNLDSFLDHEIEAKIIKVNRKRSNVVLSRKEWLEEANADKKAQTLRYIEEEIIVEGRIKNLLDYGAFVDLGGIDGLLHITDMSWGRLHHPNEIFEVGDVIQAKVLKVDRERERVSLGYKQLSPDPWSSVEDRYRVGAQVTGKVASVADYGAVIELESGVEGLVHVSEMSWSKRFTHPSTVVNPGDTVLAEILTVDSKSRRISLGMKQVQVNPWLTLQERYHVGMRIRGRVIKLTDFGAFVEIEDGVDGMVHVSDISWSARIKKAHEVLTKGQEVDAIITSIDIETRRLALSIKALTPNAWARFVSAHSPGDVVRGRISRFANFGAFVELDDNLEGLCHNSELSEVAVAKPQDAVQLGQEMDFKILRIDSESKKIGLSVRAVGKDEPIIDTKVYSSEVGSSMASLGELADFGLADSEPDE